MYKIILSLLFIFISTSYSEAHNWYDSYCCNDNDCSEVLSKENTEHGSWIITSKKGMVLVPYDFPKKPSLDDKEHICIYFDGYKLVVRCYYVPSGT